MSQLSSITITVGLVVASATLACVELDDTAGEAAARRGVAFYDQPHYVPDGEPYTGEKLSSPEPQVVESPDECKRGRGIDNEGNCVRLASQDLEFGGMVQIPAGGLLRGDIPQKYDAGPSRSNPHVEFPGQPLFQDLQPNYWIDGYEVSRKAYSKCVSEGGCTPAVCLDGSDGRPTDDQIGDRVLASFPQTCVTHDQAESYCEWRGHRLPTEGEWEYAARGPKAWMYPWGNEFRDELGLALGPVGFDPLDVSYFGLLGFGGNANEWVAESFDPDANIKQYLGGEFRTEQGPYARNWAEWVRKLCGGSSCELGQRYVVKGGRSGARAGAWQLAPGQTLAEVPESNFEGDRAIAQHDRLGFRCAKDFGDDTTSLTVPESSVALPLRQQVGELEVFLGVAEAVDREEAARFCQVLVAPGDPKEPPAGGNGWRLPTLAEIATINEYKPWFAGPGPFWTADGAASENRIDPQTSEWALTEAEDGDALMARCIRG